MLVNFLLNEPEGVEICSTERGIPCSKAAISILDEKGIGDSFVKEANAKVLGYSQFSQDPQFDNSELKANPDGLYYKVFGTLSSGDITPEEGAKNPLRGHHRNSGTVNPSLKKTVPGHELSKESKKTETY